MRAERPSEEKGEMSREKEKGRNEKDNN